MPNIAKPTISTTALEAENTRDWKKLSGSIGSRVRASRQMKAANSTAAVTSTVPITSSVFVVVSLDSTTAHQVTPAAITPIGTLIQNTADHDTFSTRNPPSSGPIARPRPEMPAQTPMAVGSCLRGKADTRIDND